MQIEYYKNQLTFAEIKAYDAICRALLRQSEYAEFAGGLTNEQISRVYVSVLYDHPEFFYAPRAIATCSSRGEVKVSLQSVDDKVILKKAETAMRETARSFSIVGGDEVSAEKKLLDYFVYNATYEINYQFNQNAASAIYFKKAQCSGFASAFKYFADKIGIWCLVVDGTVSEAGGNGAHAWNIVRIKGEYYHVDPTMTLGSNTDKPQNVRYSFLNLGDDGMIARGYAWDRSKVPACPKSMFTDDFSPSTQSGESCPSNEKWVFRRLYDVENFILQSMKEEKSVIPFSLDIPQYDCEKLAGLVKSITQRSAQQLTKGVSCNIRSFGSRFTISVQYK